MKPAAQIEQTKAALQKARPRSRRRTELELRLRDLMARQLRSEIRASR